MTYDILAMSGGAKLYSQLSALYSFVTDSDGPVTQGMREAYADWAQELGGAEGMAGVGRRDRAAQRRLARAGGAACRRAGCGEEEKGLSLRSRLRCKDRVRRF